MSAPIQTAKVLIDPSDLTPLCPEFEVVGTFNPAAIRYRDEIILLVRVAEQPPCPDPDCLYSPRAVWHGGKISWVTDIFDPKGVDVKDPRKFYLPDGSVRLRFISHLRLVRLSADGLHVKEIAIIPDLLPLHPWEEFGIEDARIVKIGDLYYITYVGVSRQHGIVTALMTTRDFQTYERHGIIFPTENKDVVLLPEKWQGKFVAYHRPVSDQQVKLPSIETALSTDAVYWGRFGHLIGPRVDAWDSVKIGMGPPPVRLISGWLFLYHGVSPANAESPVGCYCVGAALIDGDTPFHLIARSEDPLICPDRPYEQQGYVPNVIFPTGAVLSSDAETLILFSGAADEVVTHLSISVQAVLDHLKQGK